MTSLLNNSPSTAHPFTTQDLTQDTTNGVANPFLSLPTEMLHVIFQHVIAGCTPKEAAVRAIALGRVSCLLHTLTHNASIESVINRVKHLDNALIILWTRCIAPKLADEVAGFTAEEIRAWMKDPANTWRLEKFLEIDLSNCELKVVPPEIRRLFRLEELLLNNNQITTIDPFTFAGCKNLQILNLGNNQITKIYSSTFAGCLALKCLRLNDNQIVQIAPLTFEGHENLQQLYLDNNQIVQINPSTFAGCKVLQELSLDNNLIVQIASDAFVDCKDLQTLHLNNNQIVQIDPLIFAGCIKLLELHLDHNKIVQVTSDAFAGCKDLQRLTLNNNQIVQIDPSTFAGRLSLRVLHLNDNLITLIDPSTFAGCLSLHTLDLGHNQIIQIAPLTFAGCTQLNKLYLGHNQIIQITSQTLAGCKGLVELGLEHNPIAQVASDTFASCPKLCELHLASNSLLCTWVLDEQNIQQTLKTFARYICKSPWAKLYKSISEGKLSTLEIVEHLKHLKECNLIYEMVYWEAKETAELKGGVFSDGGDHHWGEHHVCDDMPIFSRALKRAIRAKYEALSPVQKTSVHRKIYEMDKQTRGDRLVDRGNDPIKWAEEHREDHVLRFLDAMDQL